MTIIEPDLNQTLQLKPCPFCGGKPSLYILRFYKTISCKSCLAEIKANRSCTIKDFSELWNRRINETDKNQGGEVLG